MPCGGRPSTINISNWREYILDSGPSSKAIVEGANSFITPEARDLLQEQGVWIIKDASANKCGVITSSYEIISGLILGSAEFIKAKPELIKQVMEILRERASKEAAWLFHNFKKSGVRMTELTEQLSLEINRKNEEIAKFLDKKPEYIRNDIILAHLPALFRKTDPKLLDRLPIEYKKAIVSVELACRIIYGRSENLEDEVCSAIDDIKKSTK
jgi:glutamate dehydrogenase